MIVYHRNKPFKTIIMKKNWKLLFAALMLGGISLAGCKKESSTSPVKDALTAKTWQMQQVTEYIAGVPNQLYKRGEQNNQDDYDLVRQKYTTTGAIHYTDQFGDSGTDGSYELLDNTRIRISYQGLSVTGENLKVNAAEYAYTLKVEGGDSLRFVFSPAP
jgi:hypothetical protein